MSSLTVLLSLLGRGGAETQAVLLCRGLAARGWSCRVLSLLPPEDFQTELADAGVPVVPLGLRGAVSLPAVLGRLAGELRCRRPDILLTMTYHANILGKVVGRACRVPVVVGSIRSEHFGGRGRDALERLTEKFATVTTTNSAAVAQRLQDRRVVSRGRIAVVPNAVALDQAPPDAGARERIRRELGLAADAIVVLNVGRLVAAKDQSCLLRAFAQVHQAVPAARLVIVGDGPLGPDLRAQAGNLGLGAAVVFTGARRDVPALLAAADGFVLSSAWEGQPNVLLEAMAAGAPVVATRAGGADELLAAAGCGPAVAPGAPADLAEALVRMLTLDPVRRADLSRAGLRYVREHHDPERVVDRWVALLGGLLAARKERR